MPATQMKTIEIPADLYSRLSSHAVGFDTPASVIERLLNNAGKPSATGAVADSIEPDKRDIMGRITMPKIVYAPNDSEGEFKRDLLNKKQAYVGLVYYDGELKIRVWDAQKITEKSSVRGNVLTGPLRGWRERGICKAIVSTSRATVERVALQPSE